MGWLLEIYIFFRDFDRHWGSSAARRRSLADIAWVISLLALFGLIALLVATIRMHG